LEDSRRTGCKLYLHEKWEQIPIIEELASAAPTKLAIGVEGGFAGAPKFEVQKESFLVVVDDNSESHSFPISDESIPEFVRNICQAVLEHQGMRSNMQLDVWEADTDVFESKYAADLEQLDNGKVISNDPASWRCEKSGDTSNLWLNLSTGYIGGGRKNWDGSGGSGAALDHYVETGRRYPLCVKLGTCISRRVDLV
jgi:ubiquitin carboxyl-terminal hydrolase 5/13